MRTCAAGEPFEKCVYHKLKQLYPNNIYKQFEYLNDIYLKHPKHISLEQRYALMNSPTALFLLSPPLKSRPARITIGKN
ncbi:HincII family type II restriction endonuclease [Fibrobacter intestinalis]|uniref:HincII family type II restriction endonuclease n=1 Tax=Fibrobacter TaxID=832 RepID=UPI0035169110